MVEEKQQHYESINLSNILGLEEYRFSHFDQNKEEQVLRGLSHINFFIGPNNSGKSRLIRAFFITPFEFNPNDIDWSAIIESTKKIHQNIQDAFKKMEIMARNPDSILGRNSVDYQLRSDEFKDFSRWDFLKSLIEKNDSVMDKLQRFRLVLERASMCRDERVLDLTTDINAQAKEILSQIKNYKLNIGNETRCYIPILRGLRPVDDEKGKLDVYSERTKKDYFGKNRFPEKNEIFTGQRFYHLVRENLLGTTQQNQLHQDYKKFLQSEFFEGKNVELWPKEKPEFEKNKENILPVYYEMVWIKLGDEEERPVCNLGDGIQTILMMTYQAFMSEERMLFFIEEPDAYLHPGMQRKLLEILSTHERFKKHQFFMTTHSNHMLDMTLDYREISLYLLKPQLNETEKKIERHIHLVSNADRQILSELGARSSSVFLTNASIWVEGKHDRKYLRGFLKKYLDSDKSVTRRIEEDTHYSFIEGGGANLVHFDFSNAASDEDDTSLKELIKVSKICGDMFLVLDGDNRDADKNSRYRKFVEQIGEDNIYCSESCKEIENFLDAGTIREFVKSTPNGQILDPTLIDKVAETEYQKKNEDGSYVGLGKYLDEKLDLEYFSEKTKGGKKGKGALKDYLKDKLFKIFLDRTESGEFKLTNEAEVLCKKLYEFVRQANHFEV